jgi:hypothetical protein
MLKYYISGQQMALVILEQQSIIITRYLTLHTMAVEKSIGPLTCSFDILFLNNVSLSLGP